MMETSSDESGLSTFRSESDQPPREGHDGPARVESTVLSPHQEIGSLMTPGMEKSPKLVPLTESLAKEESARVVTASTVFDEEALPDLPQKKSPPFREVRPRRFFMRTDPSIPLSPPKPLVCYLPPSPFISRDGRLDLGDYPGPTIQEIAHQHLPQVVLEAVQAMGVA